MLQKGDILYIHKGVALICEEIPEIYFRNHHPYSKKLTTGRVTVGTPITPKNDIRELREEISKLVQFAFAFHQAPLDLSILQRFINHQVPQGQEDYFIVPAGKYIVTEIRQVSTARAAHLQTYDPELPIRKISLDVNVLDGSDRRLFELVGRDLGHNPGSE